MADILFSKEHEWIQRDGETSSIVIIGITDYAQDNLGDIVYIDLPEVGAEFKKGSDVAVVESAKVASDIYAPITGEVVEVNQALEENPHFINESPQDKGWLFKMKITDESQFDSLMTEQEYISFLEDL